MTNSHTALPFAAAASSALVAGAAAGARWEPPRKLLAALTAFAAGALTAALATVGGFLLSFLLSGA